MLAYARDLEQLLSDLAEEINDQGVAAEHFEEVHPAAVVHLGDQVDDDRENAEVDSHRAQHIGAGPELLVDREDCIPPQGEDNAGSPRQQQPDDRAAVRALVADETTR